MPASQLPRRLAGAHVCIALLAAGLCTSLESSRAQADPTDDSAPDVVVDASAQSPEDALGKLATQYGFTIERSGPRADTDVVTGHFEGPLDDVVSRVLSDENHLIHHEAGKPAGIAKIVLLGQPAKATQPGATPGYQSPVVPVSGPAPIAMAVIAPDPAPQPAQAAATPRPEAPAAAVRNPATAQKKRQVHTSLRTRRGYRVTNN